MLVEYLPQLGVFGAGIEHSVAGQTKPALIPRVELAEAEIDRISRRDVTLCGRGGAGSTDLCRRLCPAIDVKREGASVAFGLHDRSDSLRGDIGRTLRRQCEYGSRRVCHYKPYPETLIIDRRCAS